MEELVAMRAELDQRELAAMQAEVAALAGGTKESNAAPRPQTWQEFRPEQHEVPWTAVPREQLGRAQTGVDFVKKMYPELRSTDMDVKWFSSGESCDRDGQFRPSQPNAIWVRLDLEPWRTVETAAHEAAHLAGFWDEGVATMIGRLAVRHWAGNAVYKHFAEPADGWLPAEVAARGDGVPPDAMVLGWRNSLPTAFANYGTGRAPQWREAKAFAMVA